MHGNFSPDGSLIAYTSSESAKYEVNVETMPRSDKKSQVSTNGGYEPRWRADGRELYYLSDDRKLMAVSVGSGPSSGAPQVLFQTRVVFGVNTMRTHYVPSRTAGASDQRPNRRRGAGSNYSRSELAGRTEALSYPRRRKGRFPSRQALQLAIQMDYGESFAGPKMWLAGGRRDL